MKNLNILGINLTNQKREELLESIKSFLRSENFVYIVTPNPEIVLQAQNDEEFFNVLNHASLSIPDGIGLKFASWTFFSNLKRTTGADLTKDLIEYAEKNRIKIAVINWSKSLSQKSDIENYFKEKHPQLEYIVRDFERGENYDLEEIKNFLPKILFASLGAPYQEMFMYKNAKEIPSLRLGMGVGGTFDFLSKKIKRAPAFFRFLGLEWLWRVFQEPQGRKLWRLRRIYQAVAIFPLKFLQWRFVLPFFYRKNVACLVYKKEAEEIRVLVVKRRDQENEWQIIQGGIENLSIEEAAQKEISEELNIKDFKVIKTTEFVHRYKFPPNNLHRGGVNKRHAGYKGQKQALAIAKFYGTEEEIKVNYWDHIAWKWVSLEELPESVHDNRKKVTKIFCEISKKELEKIGDLG